MTPEQEQLRLQMEMEAEAEAEATPSQKLTENDGVKHLELKKVAPDVSDPELPPEKPGLIDNALSTVGEYLSPKTATGAAAHGVSQGATLGFADELFGALDADAKQPADLQKVVDDHAEAERTGTAFDPRSPVSAPQIPGMTTYQLKREGQPTQTVVRVAKTPVELERTEVTPWADAYRQTRDSWRDQFKTAEKEHPAAYMGGEVLGSMAVPLPGVGKAKGLAKVGKYALQGADIGALAGLGNSDADLVEGASEGKLKNFVDAAVDTGTGMAGGAAFGAGVGGVAAKLDPWLEQRAARAAYKAMDPYMRSIAEGLGPDVAAGKVPMSDVYAEIERLGKKALDEGIIPEGKLGRFADPETLNANAIAKLRETGVLKGATVDAAQDALTKLGQPTPVSLGRLASRVEQEAESAKLAGNQKLARRLLAEARDLRQTVVDRSAAGFSDPAAQSLQEAEALKTGLQGQIDYGRPLASRNAQTAVARLAKEQAERAIESGLGPDELDMFKALKSRYGDLATLAKTSGHGAIRQFRNQSASLGDKAAATIGAAAGHGGTPEALALAATLGGANKVARTSGSAALARTLANAAARTSPALTPASSIEPWAKMLGEDDQP